MSPIRQHRGAVLITAMLAMMVMFLVGISFLQISSQQTREAERHLANLRALASADAGLNYMIWNQKYPNESQNKIADTNLQPGNLNPGLLNSIDYPGALLTDTNASWNQQEQFNAWLLKYTLPGSPAGTTDGYQVISKGRFRGYQKTIRAILRTSAKIIQVEPPINPPPPPVLDYALFSGTNLSISGSSQIAGDIGCNLDLSVNSTAATVIGKAVAGGRIYTKKPQNITGNRLEHQPQVILSDIIQLVNLYYYAAANSGCIVENGNRTFWGNQLVAGKVIYVKGDVVINANTTFDGIVTIVAEGNIKINGNVSNTGSNVTSNLILMSPNAINITVNGNASIYATIIAPGVQAVVDGLGSAKIFGAVVANSVSAGGNLSVQYLRPNNDAVIVPVIVGEELDDTLSWTTASWQQLPGM